MNCLSTVAHVDWKATFGMTLNTTSPPRQSSPSSQQHHSISALTAAAASSSWPLSFPCQEHNIILHHHKAGELLLNKTHERVGHICEYLLLIDKVKSPVITHSLHKAATGHHYRDFSPVFSADGLAGWNQLFTEYSYMQQCFDSSESGNMSTTVAVDTNSSSKLWLGGQTKERTLNCSQILENQLKMKHNDVNIADRARHLRSLESKDSLLSSHRRHHHHRCSRQNLDCVQHSHSHSQPVTVTATEYRNLRDDFRKHGRRMKRFYWGILKSLHTTIE